MKRVLFILLMCFQLVLMNFGHAQAGAPGTILATTYPVWQLVRMVTQGRGQLQVDLMLPAALGCPHDYALTPQDMRKLVSADVLVINGCGLEDFLDGVIRGAASEVTVIDSTQGYDAVLPYADEGEQTGVELGHHGLNPHIFVSPHGSAYMARHIAESLATIDPEGAALYRGNAERHAASMQKLLADFRALGARHAGKQIIAQYGVFDYLVRDMGLGIAASLPDHEGVEPSAAELLAMLKHIKAARVCMIWSEPAFAGRTGSLLSKETGIPEIVLESATTGSEDAPLDEYAQLMRQNLDILERASW